MAARPLVLSLALCALLAACAAPSGRGTLSKLMAEQVGKSADDPSAYPAQHARERVGRNRMRNGHIEEEYRAGFRDNCRVFFEIDPQTRKILNWRYGIPDDDCIGPE